MNLRAFLIDDLKKWWYEWSTWLIGINATLLTIYEVFGTVQAFVPASVAHWVTVALLGLTGLAKIIKQKRESTAPSVTPS